jgi:hypothetical protein
MYHLRLYFYWCYLCACIFCWSISLRAHYVYASLKYHHQDSDIANAQFMWILLYHGLWTN